METVLDASGMLDKALIPQGILSLHLRGSVRGTFRRLMPAHSWQNAGLVPATQGLDSAYHQPAKVCPNHAAGRHVRVAWCLLWQPPCQDACGA